MPHKNADKCVNTDEYDGSTQDLWAFDRRMKQRFHLRCCFVAHWCKVFEMPSPDTQSLWWEYSNERHKKTLILNATCKLNSWRAPIKSQALRFAAICLVFFPFPFLFARLQQDENLPTQTVQFKWKRAEKTTNSIPLLWVFALVWCFGLWKLLLVVRASFVTGWSRCALMQSTEVNMQLFYFVVHKFIMVFIEFKYTSSEQNARTVLQSTAFGVAFVFFFFVFVHSRHGLVWRLLSARYRVKKRGIAAPRYRDHLLFYFFYYIIWMKCLGRSRAHRLGWKLYGFDFDTVFFIYCRFVHLLVAFFLFA